MTILRPVMGPSSMKPNGKTGTGTPIETARQVAADLFWNWAEARILAHTDKLCETSVESIARALADQPKSDRRMQTVLTQSAVTLDSVSPFDKLSSTLVKRGIVAVRVSGSANPSLDSLQQAMLLGVLGVTSSVVYADSTRTGVSLKGLDLSLVEDIGIENDLVIVIEDGDAIEKEVLFRMVQLVYHLHLKVLATKKCRVSVVLDTNLGEALIEEVVSDERIYAGLALTKAPLINARDLSARIRSIFFGNTSEVAMYGFPVCLDESDLQFLTTSLPSYTLSPLELSCHILVIVANWFRTCRFAFLCQSVVSSIGRDDTEDQIACLMEQSLKIHLSRLKNELKSSKVVTNPPAFVRDVITNNLIVQQRLAIMGRVLCNFATGIRGEDTHVATIDEVTTLRIGKEDLPKSFSLDTLIDKCVLELRSKQRDGRPVDLCITDTIRANEDLITELVSVLGLSEAGPVDSVAYVNERLSRLVGQTYNKSKVIDAFFTEIQTFLEKSLGPLYASEEDAETQRLHAEMHGLLRGKPVADIEGKMTQVGNFDATVEFFRQDWTKKIANSAVVDDGLKEVHQVGSLVFGGAGPSIVKAAEKKTKTTQNGKKDTQTGKTRVTSSHVDFDFITETFANPGFELAESLATLEFLGLVKPPGAVDVSGTRIKVRKVYRDTWLAGEPGSASEEDDEQ